MTDDKGKGLQETVADEVKTIVGEVYKDGAAPTVNAVGATVGRIVRAVLGPLDIAAGVAERFFSRVERKLAGVPEERRLLPPANIAAPAALQYALLGEDQEVAVLRELFENLLMTSMDRATAAMAHPAFVGMIPQMTPDEAWILKSIDRRRYPAVILFEHSEEGYLLPESSLGFRTLLGVGVSFDESRKQQYISNLDRLGILRIDWATSAVTASDREALERQIDAEFADRSLHRSGGSISVTPLGQQFIDTCVCPKR